MNFRRGRLVAVAPVVVAFAGIAPVSTPANPATICNVKAGPNVNLSGCNLTGQNLTGLNLYFANFTRANIAKTNLQGAKLGAAIFTGTRSGGVRGTPASLTKGYKLLSGYLIGPKVNLVSTVLTKVNLTGADLAGANLTSADLAGTNLFAANLVSAVFDSANLTGANLQRANATSAQFSPATLTGAHVFGTTFHLANFHKATLKSISDKDIALSTATTPKPTVNMTNANLTNADLAGASLSGASMQGSSCTGCNLTNVNWAGADLSGLNFAGAILSTVDLQGVTLNNATMVGTNCAEVNLSSSLDNNVDWTGADLAAANLDSATITGGNFTSANMGGATFDGTISGKLTGTPSTITANYVIRGGYLFGPSVDISNQNLHGDNMSSLDLTGANLRHDDLTAADLSGTKLDSADLTDANLTGANVTGATDSGATTTGVLPAVSAVGHTYAVASGSNLPVDPTWGVLEGNSGLQLTASSFSSPAHGTLQGGGSPDGSFWYIPDTGYTGPDSFTYEVTDFFGRTATGTVHLASTTTGSIAASYSFPNGPTQLAYDGSHLWVQDLSGALNVVDPTDGSTVATYTVPGTLMGYFDGYIWTSTPKGGKPPSTTITSFDPATGTTVNKFTLAFGVAAMGYYDGDLWFAGVTGPGKGALTEVTTSGTVLATYSAGSGASLMAFDGSHIWVVTGVDYSTGSALMEFDPSKGAMLGTYVVPAWTNDLIFDGSHLWLTWGYINNNAESGVTEYGLNGSTVATYLMGTSICPQYIASDGAHVWLSSDYIGSETGLIEINPADGSLIGIDPTSPDYNGGAQIYTNALVYADGEMWITQSSNDLKAINT